MKLTGWGLATVALALAIGGCGAGNGDGEARGLLWVLDCNDKGNFGEPTMAREFDLDPKFFAAEPIEDASRASKINRLIIRLQRSGLRRESNDVLYFDIVDSFEVAACLRGAVTGGRPQYNPNFCAWGPSGPRMRIGWDTYVRAYLAPRRTCSARSGGVTGPRAVVATAVSEPSDDPAAWESWIEFAAFGNAAVQNCLPADDPAAQRTCRPASERQPIAPDFEIDFEDRLYAPHFSLTLQDSRVVEALRDREMVPKEQIGGRMEGWFDFSLERGQGIQTFP